MDIQELQSINEPGRYIIIDGPPCVGVTTQLELLARRLRNGKYNIQIITTQPSTSDLEDTAVFIQELKHRGVTTLRKRFELTPLIQDFYGEGTNKDYQRINTVLSNRKLIKPDTVIILDAPADILHERYLKLHPESSDKIHDISYLDRLRTGYLWESHQRGYKVIHSVENAEKIHEQIWKELGLSDIAMPPKEAPPITTEPAAIKTVLDTKRKDLETSKQKVASIKTTPKNEVTKTVYDKQNDNPKTSKQIAYYIPKELHGEALTQYKNTLDSLMSSRAELLEKLYDYLLLNSAVLKTSQDESYKKALRAEAERILRPLVPLAFTDGPDSQTVLNSLLLHAHIESYEPAHIHAALDSITSSSNGALHDDAKLSVHKPKNEFDLLPQLVYPYTPMTLHELQQKFSSVKYEQKFELYQTLVRSKSIEPILKNIEYVWDLTTDIETILELKKYVPKAPISLQEITVRYGFDIPEIIEQANLDETYEELFDASSMLYSTLQATMPAAAPYACLLGHRIRCVISLTALDVLELHAVLKSKKHVSDDLQKLTQTIYDKACEMHPVFFDSVL